MSNVWREASPGTVPWDDSERGRKTEPRIKTAEGFCQSCGGRASYEYLGGYWRAVCLWCGAVSEYRPFG